jgi:hypothetical protein
MYEQFPRIEFHLPNVMRFVTALALDYESGLTDSESILEEKVLAFFSADVLARVEVIAPGWRRMSSYADGCTLVHVMSAFLALMLCPEYQNASIEQQALLKWIVLYHDIAKKVIKGKRDAIHGFRSAAIAGGSVAQIGFTVTDEYYSHVEDWIAITNEAITWANEAKIYIQDNHKLPKIIDGIDRIFDHNTAAALVVKTVLLHMSINVVEDWPQMAPLTEAETSQFIDATILPLLKIMMLVDNDAWSLFDQPTKEKYRGETLAVFRGIEYTN